jgi:hypothetical protein
LKASGCGARACARRLPSCAHVNVPLWGKNHPRNCCPSVFSQEITYYYSQSIRAAGLFVPVSRCSCRVNSSAAFLHAKL